MIALMRYHNSGEDRIVDTESGKCSDCLHYTETAAILADPSMMLAASLDDDITEAEIATMRVIAKAVANG